MKHLPLRERFEAKYMPEPNSGCWLWIAARDRKSYGVIGTANRRIDRAHRISYMLHHGYMPENSVLHKCDTPECVNPDHLFVGTQKDNVQDMLRKHRDNAARGENAGQAKLTDVQIVEIREMASKKVSSRAIGAKYGVSHTCILWIL